MNITIDASDAKNLARAFQQAPKKVMGQTQGWVETSAAKTHRHAATQEVPVDKGQLQSSIRPKIGTLHAEVKPWNLKHALWVHEGTGIYGPKKRRIEAKGRALRIETDGGVIYRKSSAGQRPNKYMQRTFDAVKPSIDRDAQRLLQAIVSSI